MKKNILTTLLCLFAIATVIPDSAAAQNTKGLKRSIIINNGDTVVNGKNFSGLDKNEKDKLRKEFKEMESTFKASPGSGKGGNVVIRRRTGDNERDVVISRNGKEPNVLFWNDNINDDLSFSYGDKMSGDLKVFQFNGDSSMSFSFNGDTLMKSFNFEIDSNLRKRIITMHRDIAPGRPGGAIMRREMAPFRFETRAFPGSAGRNNSSSFNYNYTDRDGISSRMSIRLSDADKEQLKKITGAETIARTLEVNDLTLFPNFSNGKISLSFNINSKGNTKISVLDSDMKALFNDEAANFSGNYIKQVSLPKNGVYYVTVSQNGSWFVRKLIKE